MNLGQIANLERMGLVHCLTLTLLGHVIKMMASYFDTVFVSQIKLIVLPLIHYFETVQSKWLHLVLYCDIISVVSVSKKFSESENILVHLTNVIANRIFHYNLYVPVQPLPVCRVGLSGFKFISSKLIFFYGNGIDIIKIS